MKHIDFFVSILNLDTFLIFDITCKLAYIVLFLQFLGNGWQSALRIQKGSHG